MYVRASADQAVSNIYSQITDLVTCGLREQPATSLARISCPFRPRGQYANAGETGLFSVDRCPTLPAAQITLLFHRSLVLLRFLALDSGLSLTTTSRRGWSSVRQRAQHFHRPGSLHPAMKIQSLLNPFIACDNRNGYRSSESPIPASMPMHVASYTSLPRRQKIPKDAPIFSEGNKVVGHVNYPPHEGSEDAILSHQHHRFQVFPMGEIRRKGIRHIPYNSDKKDFLDKTGRESFESMPATSRVQKITDILTVFQYTYRVPGEEKEYVVVWDYNVGLVRMTPFFKSLKHSKVGPRCSCCSCRVEVLTPPDHTSKSLEGEPRPQGHKLQHHRRSPSLSR